MARSHDPIAQPAHTRSRDKDATRQRLLDAAETVFAEKGYHGAVVDDIIRASDSSKGGFYFHFPNKQAIFLALVDALVPKLEAAVDRAIAARADPVAQLDAALRAVLETFSRHRRLSKILLVEAVGLGHGFDEKLMRARPLRRHDPRRLESAVQAGAIAAAGHRDRRVGLVWRHQRDRRALARLPGSPSGWRAPSRRCARCCCARSARRPTTPPPKGWARHDIARTQSTSRSARRCAGSAPPCAWA